MCDFTVEDIRESVGGSALGYSALGGIISKISDIGMHFESYLTACTRNMDNAYTRNMDKLKRLQVTLGMFHYLDQLQLITSWG